eukprot:TRINITY_DN8443_c0_g1_i6.p1 TRINITY_DN8443_c0_g1~~TRINITY_DN8443_c0_g1_i6.p1  ORF type:complete len:227 (+),score=18.42 TRINITY_DN8443_c0_g1_i6:71-751(+)
MATRTGARYKDASRTFAFPKFMRVIFALVVVKDFANEQVGYEAYRVEGQKKSSGAEGGASTLPPPPAAGAEGEARPRRQSSEGRKLSREGSLSRKGSRSEAQPPIDAGPRVDAAGITLCGAEVGKTRNGQLELLTDDQISEMRQYSNSADGIRHCVEPYMEELKGHCTRLDINLANVDKFSHNSLYSSEVVIPALTPSLWQTSLVNTDIAQHLMRTLKYLRGVDAL